MPVCVTQVQNNELAVEDVDGGTFTISNGGVFGSLFGTLIINPPPPSLPFWACTASSSGLWPSTAR